MLILSPIPKQFLDESGVPYTDGTVSIYLHGDTEFAEVYADAEGTALIENPCILDSHGMWQGFVDSDKPLDYIVKDSEGNVITRFCNISLPTGDDIPGVKVISSDGSINVSETLENGERTFDITVNDDMFKPSCAKFSHEAVNGGGQVSFDSFELEGDPDRDIYLTDGVITFAEGVYHISANLVIGNDECHNEYFGITANFGDCSTAKVWDRSFVHEESVEIGLDIVADIDGYTVVPTIVELPDDMHCSISRLYIHKVSGAGVGGSMASVEHDDTLVGDGTHNDPLGVKDWSEIRTTLENTTNELLDHEVSPSAHQDIRDELERKEDKDNKVTSWGSTLSDEKYPSEKLVKDTIDNLPPGTAVKGDAESEYRTGNVNLTPANIGAATASQGAKADTAVQGVKVNGTELSKDGNNVVDVPVPTASAATPLKDGTASAGSSSQWARGDHRHPTDDSREAVSNKKQSIDPTSTTEYGSSKAVADFVNSSVATNTANFLGSFTLTDLSLTYPATDVQIAAALNSHTWPSGVTPTNNDYVYVEIQDPQTTGIDDKVERFKFSDMLESWGYEYMLNNSSFTAAEMATLESGVTASDKTNWNNHVSNTSNPHGVTAAQVGAEPAFSVLPIAKGGTGAGTIKGALSTLTSETQHYDTLPTDDILIVHKFGTATASNGALYTRKLIYLWTYIQNKISSVLGLTASSYDGKAATAGAADTASAAASGSALESAINSKLDKNGYVDYKEGFWVGVKWPISTTYNSCFWKVCSFSVSNYWSISFELTATNLFFDSVGQETKVITIYSTSHNSVNKAVESRTKYIKIDERGYGNIMYYTLDNGVVTIYVKTAKMANVTQFLRLVSVTDLSGITNLTWYCEEAPGEQPSNPTKFTEQIVNVTPSVGSQTNPVYSDAYGKLQQCDPSQMSVGSATTATNYASGGGIDTALQGKLGTSGNGSSLSVTPDGTSTGYDLGSSTTLKAFAQKFKNLVSALKALAFKDKASYNDLSSGVQSSLDKADSALQAHQSVTDNNPTLAWGATSKVGSVGSTDLRVTMPSNPAQNLPASVITSGTFGTDRIADDAITAAKVKDNETLPVNVRGTAGAVTSIGEGQSNAARHVWFSDANDETKRVHNNNFTYNPVGNIISANISGNANGSAAYTNFIYDGESAGQRGNGQKVRMYGIDNTNNAYQSWYKVATIKKKSQTSFTSARLVGTLFASGSNWAANINQAIHLQILFNFVTVTHKVYHTPNPNVKSLIRIVEINNNDTYELQIRPQALSNYSNFRLYIWEDQNNDVTVSFASGDMGEAASNGTVLDNYQIDPYYGRLVNNQVGDSTTPVYVDSNGQVRPCDVLSGGTSNFNRTFTTTYTVGSTDQYITTLIKNDNTDLIADYVAWHNANYGKLSSPPMIIISVSARDTNVANAGLISLNMYRTGNGCDVFGEKYAYMGNQHGSQAYNTQYFTDQTFVSGSAYYLNIRNETQNTMWAAGTILDISIRIVAHAVSVT